MYVCQSRPLTVELGGLLRAFDCFYIGYVGMVTTTFGAQQLAALVALLNYDHIPLRYRFICDFFFVVGGEFFWRHSIFWIVLTILVF